MGVDDMNELAKEILDTVEVGALATVNADRTPLVTPLHFARFGNSIIWISEPTARHSENAFRNGKAEFVVWDYNGQLAAFYCISTISSVKLVK